MLAPEIEKKDVLERAKRVEYPDSALRILPGLIAEVEAKDKQIKELQNIINKPPEEAQWMTDYHLLQSALDGPIIESARRWHGAFRKAQNSNLIRLQQNERLEAEVERLRSQSVEQVFRRKNEELAAKDAYIKRLEAAFLDSEIERLNNPDNNHSWYPGDESYVDFVNRVKREAEQKAREALERIKDGKG